MCSDNHHDIPIRTLVVGVGSGYRAHCLDFNLTATGPTPEDALDTLEEQMAVHLQRARKGKNPLFMPAPEGLWKLYFQTAEARLLATGEGHAHIENRPLLCDAPVAAST
ncbi:MAG: hypothetical protein KC910_34440 [Candidatus Eremiobacteraeota bacterium]|nr:hypothetical protein [Candidatus Eremiobacteraeota bacterium]